MLQGCDYCRRGKRVVVFLVGEEGGEPEGYGACFRCCDAVLQLYYQRGGEVHWPSPEDLFDRLVDEILDRVR